MALIHHASAVIFREINCEAVRDHVQHLQPLVTREAYFQSLKEYAPVIPDSLDLEEPPRPPFNLRKAMEMSEKLYAKIVDRIRTKKQKEKDLKEEEDKAKRKLEEEVANGKPEKLLDDVIDAKVSAILAERDGDICDDSQNQEELDAKAAKLVQILRDQTQKNGGSPSGGSGQNSKKEKKKKGKGKGKDKSKSKHTKKEEKAIPVNSSQSTNVTSPSQHKPPPWRETAGENQGWNPRKHLQDWSWKPKPNTSWWKRIPGQAKDYRGVNNGEYKANQWASWTRRKQRGQSFL